jgi:hypothetical protein
MSDEHNPRAEIGGNLPPDESVAIVARIMDDLEDLLDRQVDLELERLALPVVVTTEAQATVINAFVVKARLLARDFEARRVEIKAPYLLREKLIDGAVGGRRATVLGDAKNVEQRNTAFLQAKRRREEAEARAKAEAAAAARRAQEAEAAAARERQRKAEAERVAQERAVAEAARKSAAEAAAAEAALREAHRKEEAAAKAAESADTGVRQAQLAEDRAERRVAQPERLGRAGGGGANAKVVMKPRYRIESLTRLLGSLGPLNPYVDMRWLEGPLQRWANIAQGDPKIREDIPGVEYFEEPETKTTPTRGAS